LIMHRPVFSKTKVYAERLDAARRKAVKPPPKLLNPFTDEELEKELWACHPTLTDYQVSTLGRVKGPRNILRTAPCKNRLYVYVQIRSKIYAVHRLVLETFVGPCPDGLLTCHNDGDPTNNRVNNLRWDTPKANAADRVSHGNTWAGGRNGSKLSKSQRQKVFRLKEEGVSVDRIAKRLGVTPRRIYQILASAK
jgi:HNH endonuclease/Homeodomain-like domain